MSKHHQLSVVAQGRVERARVACGRRLVGRGEADRRRPIVRTKGDQLVEGWNAFDFLTCFQQIGFNLQ